MQGQCPRQVFSFSNRTKNPIPVLKIPGSFMEFPGSLHPLLSQDFLWTVLGLSGDSPRTFLGLTKDFLRNFSELSQDFVIISSGLSKDLQRTFPGLSMDSPKTFSGLSQNYVRTSILIALALFVEQSIFSIQHLNDYTKYCYLYSVFAYLNI